MSDLLNLSAAEIARRIARRELSSVDATQAFLTRIAAVNPALNAVAVPRFEKAMLEAKAADQQLTRGEPVGPLHGVPITVKECFFLSGTPSTIGLDSSEFKKPVEKDGTPVARLKRAGAVIMAKTNLPQLMIWHETDNPVYGRTNNPWDLERTCGGSSGGEAAIIAARGAPFGVGNDLGGSIRVPCHFCGIHGIRPTSFRMTRYGSARTLRGFETFMTQTGPMARHVEDLWLGLQVLTDSSDGFIASDIVPAPLPDPARVQIDKLKIAAWPDDSVFPPSAAVVRAVRESVAMLRASGAEVIELSPADVNRHFHANEAFDLYCALVGSDGGADARRLSHGSTLDPRVARLLWIAGLPRPMRAVVVAALRQTGQEWTARLVSNARSRTTDGYWQLVERKNQLAAQIIAYMRQECIDAILCPPHALPAMPHVKAFDLLAAGSYVMLINLLGLPSGSVSTTRVAPGEDAGRKQSRDKALQKAYLTDLGSVGLPVGVQVSSLPWREDVVLAILASLEKSAAGKPDYPGNYVVPAT